MLCDEIPVNGQASQATQQDKSHEASHVGDVNESHFCFVLGDFVREMCVVLVCFSATSHGFGLVGWLVVVACPFRGYWLHAVHLPQALAQMPNPFRGITAGLSSNAKPVPWNNFPCVAGPLVWRAETRLQNATYFHFHRKQETRLKSGVVRMLLLFVGLVDNSKPLTYAPSRSKPQQA